MGADNSFQVTPKAAIERALDGAAWDAINSSQADKARQASIERAKANVKSGEVLIAEYPNPRET